ncbi:hypothetical protein [Lactiplantibacillus carotarum]|uniref:hypothetical protein n=1 Tax=Lactiplantibacillus carotarum TaxID=2993456 RepID=UPI00298EF8B3|nr:hypothetical protein [Lactiplantibacillus carotarum]
MKKFWLGCLVMVAMVSGGLWMQTAAASEYMHRTLPGRKYTHTTPKSFRGVGIRIQR